MSEIAAILKKDALPEREFRTARLPGSAFPCAF
jgi:hypothetical protein